MFAPRARSRTRSPTRVVDVDPDLSLRVRSSHAFFDTSRSGRVSLLEFGDVLRGAGFSPTEKELAALLARVEPVYGSRLSANVCIVIASTLVTRADSKESISRGDVLAAFAEYEALRSPRRSNPLPKGTLALSDVHSLLTGGKGDRLSQSDFVTLLSSLPASPSGPARVDVSTLINATMWNYRS